MEMNKKSGGGDVRAKALSWNGEWDKAKNVFFGFIPLGPTRTHGGSLCSPLTSPPPEKKSASPKKNFASWGCYSCYSSYRGDSGGGGLFEAPGDGAGAVGGAVGGH